mgnify:CR=1 FL=1
MVTSRRWCILQAGDGIGGRGGSRGRGDVYKWQDAELYDRYEGWIRQEYEFVPGTAFRKGRSAVLRSFLDQGVIYHTAELREKLELPARENLSRALENLRD